MTIYIELTISYSVKRHYRFSYFFLYFAKTLLLRIIYFHLTKLYGYDFIQRPMIARLTIVD